MNIAIIYKKQADMDYNEMVLRCIDDMYRDEDDVLYAPQVDELRDQFKSILEQVYSFQALDEDELHYSMKKISHILHICEPNIEPMIERKI